MQRVRLWEVTPGEELREIPGDGISLEERLEDWLAADISALDPNLLVIGRQVRTDYGGSIDLLCLNSDGDTVVVELKKGRTPREVTAQALDYASWARGLSFEQLTNIADGYLGKPDSLALAFEKWFEEPLPDELNRNHRSLIVAESMDASTERIVRYLSSMNVPINVATVQHFTDANGRSLLAQVYLIEPQEAEPRSRPKSKKPPRGTVDSLQAMADSNGVGPLYAQLRNGVRGLLSAQPYVDRVWYRLRRDDGGMRTVLIVSTSPDEKTGGLGFSLHADRLIDQLGTDFETLQTWLPSNAYEVDLRGWAGSSETERQGARGLWATFQSADEIDTFVAALRSAIVAPRKT